MEEQPWYAHVSREIAEYRLKHCNKVRHIMMKGCIVYVVQFHNGAFALQDGAYLVRPSSTAKGTFVLSLLYGGRITHAR